MIVAVNIIIVIIAIIFLVWWFVKKIKKHNKSLSCLFNSIVQFLYRNIAIFIVLIIINVLLFGGIKGYLHFEYLETKTEYENIQTKIEYITKIDTVYVPKEVTPKVEEKKSTTKTLKKDIKKKNYKI